ncbi:MAG: substrate-binding domain-containing protein [Sediminimonas qiaohouensis]|uniref:Substrate-binding domain-containing protein n=1 Tax=Sediminimonas qiaohouensis TaxID=552061 RepID=A0A7C9HKF1_9RHOB|nr:substrate-binding domain-containing protein [Sediminimonas qiaohouensis]MTJ03748.1 substrate-binding domain-containing protein [Sediminimonas qiaohouensis]
MTQRPKVTIKDVARAAGCGVATASRVLNASGPASPDVRERVQNAARELGFSFSSRGRALQSSRSMTIGCLVPSLANPVFAEAVQGVQEALAGTGYQLLISSSNYEADADSDAISTLVEKEVDGLIVTMVAPARSSALGLARERGIPVSLMFHDPIDGLPTAHVDNFVAAREVARRFAELGHWQTAFLALRFASSDRSRNRYAGFHAECRARGLPDPTLIELSEAEANTPELLAGILGSLNGVTAIFASNDFLAIGVQSAARLMGRRVPRDLSVVGFDGIEIGRLLEVPLTTIETTPEAMGRQAAQSLLDLMQGEAPVQHPPLPFTFRAGATLTRPGAENRDDDQVAPWPPSVPSLKTDLKQG